MSDLNAELSTSVNLTAELGSVIVDGAAVELSKTGSTYKMTVTKDDDEQSLEWHDGAKGDKGDKGDTGTPGSDANVTAQNIATALGYTPLNGADSIYSDENLTGAYLGKRRLNTDGTIYGTGNSSWKCYKFDISNLSTTDALIVSTVEPVMSFDVPMMSITSVNYDDMTSSFSDAAKVLKCGVLYAPHDLSDGWYAEEFHFITEGAKSLIVSVGVINSVEQEMTVKVRHYGKFADDFKQLESTTQQMVKRAWRITGRNPDGSWKYGWATDTVNEIRLADGGNIVNFGAANIPAASSSKYGVIKSGSNGFTVGDNGCPAAQVLDSDGYDAADNNTFISKGTLNNAVVQRIGTDEWRIDGLEQSVSEQSADIAELGQLKPETAPSAVGKILKVLSVNDDGTFTCEWADAPSGSSTDVQINGTSITSEGVANIPVAASGSGTTSTYGVVKPHSNSFKETIINNSAMLQLNPATNSAITNRYTGGRPITVDNFDYAVKAALCDEVGAAYTTTEQANARKRIGLDKEWVLKGTWTDPSADFTLTDMTGYTEMVICGTHSGTGNCSLNGYIGTMQYNMLYNSVNNGTRTIAGVFRDGVFGIESNARYVGGSDAITLNASSQSCFTIGIKISDFTSLGFRNTGVCTSCNLKIYVR